MAIPAHVVSVSGGKDSTATYLLALERRDRTGRDFRAVFADTGHEHEWTLEFVNTLHEKTGGPKVRTVRADFTDRLADHRDVIRTKWVEDGVEEDRIKRALELCVPTGVPFLDMAICAARFPSPIGKFCTRELKIEPIIEQEYLPLWDAGCTVITWQGMRREESLARSDVPILARLNVQDERVKISGEVIRYLPLAAWTVKDVWKMHRRHGIEPNPLYHQGASRVGCFPCIHADKMSIRVFAERFPEYVQRVKEWERIVSDASKHGDATFFQHKGNPRFRGIDNVVAWSKTARGGKFNALLPINDIRVELGTSCGEWGACE